MEKLHVVVVGRRNVGKSSLVNAILQDKKSIVSPIAGTTTDPVRKAYEIPNFRTAVLIDTAGIDDTGSLGQERIHKTWLAIAEADVALLVIAHNCFGAYEQQLIERFTQFNIPFIVVYTHHDEQPLNEVCKQQIEQLYQGTIIQTNTKTLQPECIIEAIKSIAPTIEKRSLLDGIVKRGDIVILVTPIDSEAPTGRLILPQVQTLRNLLDNHTTSVILQPEELTPFLAKTNIKPQLVITDSQVFNEVARQLDADTLLTSFSILFARLKGNFDYFINSVQDISNLKNGDHILILESCSHHSSCDDIGRVKIPRLLQKHTGKELFFDIIPGLGELPTNLSKYAMVIQCGGCMVTTKQLQRRISPFIAAKIPVCNYGMVLSYVNGIFNRSILPFRNNP
ncbi:MAG: [FeFe] hydrogenase H-cluster maturation GTPase HydF [Marinifilaceae bacterium]